MNVAMNTRPILCLLATLIALPASAVMTHTVAPANNGISAPAVATGTPENDMETMAKKKKKKKKKSRAS
jgi:hypothetical protein